MPEGPEIRRNSATLIRLIGRRVISIKVLSGRYVRKPIEGLEKIVGKECTSVLVKGKLMIFDFGEHCVLTTAGMSGWWMSGAAEHKFKRIEMKAVDEDKNWVYTFAFVDMRNFGTFKVVTFKEAQEKYDSLGVDVFEEHPHMPGLMERLQKYGKNDRICEALLDQRIFAGVGNYIRAEAMYFSGIDPRTNARDISMDQLATLWYNINKVAVEAYELGGDYKDHCYHREVAEDGRPVKHFTDRNGRTVWYVEPREVVST